MLLYVAISVGWESGHSLVGFSASGSQNAAIKVSAGAVGSSEAQLGRDPLPNSCGCWQNLVLGRQTECLNGQPEATLSSSLLGLLVVSTRFLKASKGESLHN